jgi:hypothetical protein
MCGIVTVFGSDMGPVHGLIMKDLLILDQVRGLHATGVVKVNDQGVSSGKKEAVNAATFLEDTDNKAFVTGLSNARGIIGHNRWATMGALVAENAHPFQHDHITMVHNGTLDSQDTLATDEEHKSFVVDSNQLAFTLSKWGTQRTVRQTDGAFVLAWHNSIENSFNFVRNSKRPFWLAKVTGKDIYIGASERWMIEVACARQKALVTIDKPYELPVAQHVKFVLGKGSFTNKTARPVVTPVTLMPYDETTLGSWNSSYTGYDFTRKNYNTKVYTPPKVVSRKGNDIKSELGELGLLIQEEVKAYLTYFQAYSGSTTLPKGSRMGVAHGCLDNITGPNVPCAVHAINEKDFCMGEYTGKVSSIQNNMKDYNGAMIEGCVILNGLELQTAWTSAQDKLVEEPDVDIPFDDEADATTAWVYGPNRALISVSEFDKLAVHGCGLCTQDIFEDQDEEISWEQDTPICKDCTDRRDLGKYTPEESKVDTDELDKLPSNKEHPERGKLTIVH